MTLKNEVKMVERLRLKNTARLLEHASQEINVLKRENRINREKLWLVENLLELRHLGASAQPQSPDISMELINEAHRIQNGIRDELNNKNSNNS